MIAEKSPREQLVACGVTEYREQAPALHGGTTVAGELGALRPGAREL